MSVKFTSDLHFFHENICNYSDRLTPDATVKEHADWLVALWNAEVHPTDTIYHLGDFSFGNYTDTAELLKKLNGYKIFIKGIHDKEGHLRVFKESKLIQEYALYLEIEILDTKAVLFHFPITAWHRQGYGSIHLHGHFHGSLKDTGGLILDVGIDSAKKIYGKHKFFTEEDVLQYMQSRVPNIPDGHKDQTYKAY